MTEREANKIIKNEYCGRCDGKFICNGCYIHQAIKVLENQSVLLDFLVTIEISNICKDDRIQEWCEEHCAYVCRKKNVI